MEGKNVWTGSIDPPLIGGRTYLFSAWVRNVAVDSPALLKFSINGVQVGDDFTVTGTDAWHEFKATFTASPGGSASAVDLNLEWFGNDFALDDVSVTAKVQITDEPSRVPTPVTYVVSLCPGDALTLDGSASMDPDQGLHQTGCDSCPGDTITTWDWDLDGPQWNNTRGSGMILSLGAAFTTYFPSPGSYGIALRVGDNTALAYPDSGLPNLVGEAPAIVRVYEPGPCELSATPNCKNITLDWEDVGADEYQVYRSTAGPNTGFTLVGATPGRTLTDPVPAWNQTFWYRVLATSGSAMSMSPAVSAEATEDVCLCVMNLQARGKSFLVNWCGIPSQGRPATTCIAAPVRALLSSQPTRWPRASAPPRRFTPTQRSSTVPPTITGWRRSSGRRRRAGPTRHLRPRRTRGVELSCYPRNPWHRTEL